MTHIFLGTSQANTIRKEMEHSSFVRFLVNVQFAKIQNVLSKEKRNQFQICILQICHFRSLLSLQNA